MRRFVLIAFVCLITAPWVVAQTGTKPAAKPAPAKPAAPAAATPDRAVPFKVGEVLTYDLSWSSLMTGGTATIAIRDRHASGGRTGYAISAEANPRSAIQALFPFQYKADSLLDVKLLIPIQASTFSSERGRTRLKTTHFPATGLTIDYDVKTSTDVHSKRTVPQFTQDPLGVLYFLRWYPFKPGDNVTIPVTDGGELYYAHIHIGAVAQIKTGLGTLPAYEVQITVLDEKNQPSARKLTLWLSSDARRLPLRFDASLAVGSFVLTLAKVAP